MHPFSYTALKVIHDQKIQEALEQPHLNTGQTTQRHNLPQMFGQFLARIHNQSAPEHEKSLAGCTKEVECTTL